MSNCEMLNKGYSLASKKDITSVFSEMKKNNGNWLETNTYMKDQY